MTKAEKIERLIEYLKVKLEDRDWHALSDCANDLRVLEATKEPSVMDIHKAIIKEVPVY